jgi:hypothetical protein
MKKFAFVYILLFVVAGAPLFAQQVAGDASWDFKFTVPPGWVYQQGPDGAILGHNSIAGMIIVMPHMASSFQEVTTQMQAGIMEEGVQLHPDGKLQTIGSSIVAGNYQGMFNGQRVKAKVLGTFSPQGGGAYIFALALPNEFSGKLAGAADAIAQGMQYAKVDTSGLMAHLSGTWVSYTSNTESYMTLMPNGEYSDNSVSSYSGEFSDALSGEQTGSWGLAGQDEDRGRWTVRGNKRKGVIYMNAADGSEYEMSYQVHVENGQTYWNEYLFNGTHYMKKTE